MNYKIKKVLGLLQIILSFTACNSNARTANNVQNVQAGQQVSDSSQSAGQAGEGKTLFGTSCRSSDPQHICIGLKYVVYSDSYGGVTTNQAGAISDLETINDIWNQCNIGFQIEKYSPTDPNSSGLNYYPANDSELSGIRASFQDDSELLVIITGPWNRSGTLGYTGANAWTSMPGDYPYGAVLEQAVGTYGNIVAHELGHYLGLYHVGNTVDLMNPIIYDYSESLSSDQCAIARDTANTYWQRMLRG